MQTLEALLRETHATILLPPDWAWGWDGRFGAALLVIRPQSAGPLKECLKNHFDKIWNHQMLNMLPQDVAQLVESLDGIRAGQSLFTQTLPEDMLLWSSWWPWSGNSHISVRVGLSTHKMNPKGVEEGRAIMRSIFTHTD